MRQNEDHLIVGNLDLLKCQQRLVGRGTEVVEPVVVLLLEEFSDPVRSPVLRWGVEFCDPAPFEVCDPVVLFDAVDGGDEAL
ncbi:hypothetical protein [Alicyclobacillus fastidiosus]|uniref:hypothetical protein n=1 Tax=Alicyclobacillus fastidiosus TaxID=392011 RepID=UPI0023EA448B|nr:hypothetical protein [Alicyclobacillus fastidiosus]GMA60507.1 hypothetical protein GCM10025859_09470 [Alicyclobacillus fastidiosus]